MSSSTIKDLIELLKTKKSNVHLDFPFDGSLSGNPNETLTKVLFINFRESTRINNKDIPTLTKYIEKVLTVDDYEIIRRGALNATYYEIVNRIAFGHGIHGYRNGKPTKEYNLTSFSSKFCGSHNVKTPFWDNIVSQWLMDNGYPHKYREYSQYVEAIKRIQEDYTLNDYTLREIEYAIWSLV